jgi:hypothetical protein
VNGWRVVSVAMGSSLAALPVAGARQGVHTLQLRGMCLGKFVSQHLRLMHNAAAQVGMADIVWSDAQYTYNDGSEVSTMATGLCSCDAHPSACLPLFVWCAAAC